MYVIPLLYRISSTTTNYISISRLHHAIESVIIKHAIFRTALYLHMNSAVIQHCLDTNAVIDNIKLRGFSFTNLHNNDRHIHEIIEEILNQSDLFDLSKGCVIRCHILRHCSSNDHDDSSLQKDDFILFSIHHAVFDGASVSIFIRDLSLAYQSSDSLAVNDNTLQYIDYSVHERLIDMTSSREFWHSQLEIYNLQHPLSLPVDRSRSFIDQRSGLASSVHITFDGEMCTSFLNYASSHHLTLFQLGLATFYVFLFKLTHGETDLCIASINANRYRNELVNIIGIFVSTLPYRIQLDPHWSFNELIQHVREKCLSILQYSHYPLQSILADFHHNQSNVPFLETMFDFMTVSSDHDHICLDDANLEQLSMEDTSKGTKFDFSITVMYNSASDDNRLSCSFECSRDLFDMDTVKRMARRFQHLLSQIFIRLLTKFLRFFFKFSKTFEKVLEISILRVYKGRVNIFRMIIKPSIWTLIMN